MSRPLRAISPILLAMMLLPGCRPSPGVPDGAGGGGEARPLAAADLAAIRANDSAFTAAANAGDAAAVATVYLADARLLPPNSPPVEGREAVQKFWGGFFDAYRARFTLVSDEVEGREDLAYLRGHYTLDGTPRTKGGAPLHDEGKFLEILRRQPDGSWRYAVDMYSSNLPAPAAK
jgi:uncharacterized protein (TIGR02246 family)